MMAANMDPNARATGMCLPRLKLSNAEPARRGLDVQNDNIIARPGAPLPGPLTGRAAWGFRDFPHSPVTKENRNDSHRTLALKTIHHSRLFAAEA